MDRISDESIARQMKRFLMYFEEISKLVISNICNANDEEIKELVGTVANGFALIENKKDWFTQAENIKINEIYDKYQYNEIEEQDIKEIKLIITRGVYRKVKMWYNIIVQRWAIFDTFVLWISDIIYR